MKDWHKYSPDMFPGWYWISNNSGDYWIGNINHKDESFDPNFGWSDDDGIMFCGPIYPPPERPRRQDNGERNA